MSNALYPFKLGDFQCLAINDPIEGNTSVLLVDTGQHRLLIDTGYGDATTPPGQVLPRLQMAGIATGDIDVVVLTHADGDHIAGTADAGGRLTFPRARHILSHEENAYWASKPARFRPSRFFEDTFCRWFVDLVGTRLEQLRDRLELVESGTEIVPGVRVILAPGHTPGLMAVEISSGDERMLFIADVVYGSDLSAERVNGSQAIDYPERRWVLDVDPAESMRTRNRVLGQSAREHTLLMATHAPFPGLGYATSDEHGFRWTARPAPGDVEGGKPVP